MHTAPARSGTLLAGVAREYPAVVRVGVGACPLVVGSAFFRLFRALVPLAMPVVSKLVIDGVVGLDNAAQRQSGGHLEAGGVLLKDPFEFFAVELNRPFVRRRTLSLRPARIRHRLEFRHVEFACLAAIGWLSKTLVFRCIRLINWY